MGRRWIGIVYVIGLATLMVAPSRAQAQDDTTWLLDQINSLRASLGLSPYALNPQLTAAAAQHSQYMATTCDVSHTESNGSRPMDRAHANGYTGDWISENIYGGTTARPSDAWNFWIHSPIHYSGLVHQVVNEVGIGIAHGNCGNYYTLLFGHRGDVSAPPAPPAAPSGGDTGAGDAPPPPTQHPYVPPPPTRTPTPTIPTLTPSATWTITPTYTPSATRTAPPLTATPLVLPTVPAPGQQAPPTAVALLPSPTESATPPPATALPTPVPTSQPGQVTAAHHGGFEARNLIPLAIVGQVLLIGLAGFTYFRRAR
jgi:hypothetical protein